MARYDPNVMACEFNPNGVTDLPRAPVRTADSEERQDDVDVVDVDGQPGIAAVWARRWPTTYRWDATLDLDVSADSGARWTSRWSRNTET